MNEKPKSGGFQSRIYKYAVITTVIQLSLGIGFAGTINGGGPISLMFLIPMGNFAYLLLMLFQQGLSYTQYGTLIIAGTFFMFLIVVAVGELHHQIGRMIPSDPREEARRHANHRV